VGWGKGTQNSAVENDCTSTRKIENDTYYPYERCYDFEAMSKPVEFKDEEKPKLKIIRDHAPVCNFHLITFSKNDI